MDLDLDPAAQVLAIGSDRRPRRGRVVAAVLAAVVVLGSSAVDRGLRDREVDALLADVGSVSAAVGHADRQVSGMQQYLLPATSVQGVSARLAGDLAVLESQAREEGRQDVLDQLPGVETDRVLPWHGDVAAARERLVTYAQAEAERLATTGAERTAARASAAAALAELVAALRPLVSDPERSTRLEESLAPLPGLDDPP